MPKIDVRLTDDQAAWIEAQTRPFFKKADVVRDLIDRARFAVDSAATLGGPSAAGTPLSYLDTKSLVTLRSNVSKKVSTSKKEINAGKTRKKRTEVTPEFEAFWKAYQSCPQRVPSQSKAKAWDEWQKALKQETPERLLSAAQKAGEQALTCGWDYKLPDAARWLKEGRYSVLLENHQPALDPGIW